MMKLNDLPAEVLRVVDPELRDDLQLAFRVEPWKPEHKIIETARSTAWWAPYGRMTEARVVARNKGGSWVEIISGCAWCNPTDQFCRETGRRVALRRMIDRYRGTHLHELASNVLQRYFTSHRGAIQLGPHPMEIRKPDGSPLVAGDLEDGATVVVVPKGSHYAVVGAVDQHDAADD